MSQTTHVSPDGLWRWDGTQWVANTPPPVQASAKGAGWGWKKISAVVVSPLVVMAILAAVAPSSTTATRSAPGPTVVYYVSGTASVVDITYETPTGSSQQSGVDVPMNVPSSSLPVGMPVAGFKPGDFVYISAQRQDKYGGGPDITCSISVNGKVISANTASGGYSIATCSGSIPR